MKQMLPFLQKNLKTVYTALFMLAFATSTMFAQDVDNGGIIAANQTICPGETPDLLTSVTPATGGDTNLPIEYMWMMTTNFNNNIQSWTPASGMNNGLNYQPPVISTTTYYARCARRQGFAQFVAESNIVTISVQPFPTVLINGNPGSGYTGTTVNLSAGGQVPGATYRWDLNGDGFFETFGPNAMWTYNFAGTFNIGLQVTQGGCTLTTTQQIVINNPTTANINDPCNCGNPFNIIDLIGGAYYNHDYILINSNPGETWTINSIAGFGGGLVDGVLNPIPVGTEIPETAPGVYFLNVWFDGVLGGWQATVQNTNPFTGALTSGSGAINPCPICPQSPLPVTLVSFDGAAAEKGIQIKWVTASETDNSHFEIEKSTDGSRFSSISQVEGKGDTEVTSKYEFIDNNPTKGENYYRLKQVDFDGDYEYSNIIAINWDGVGTDLTISPNPVREFTRVKFETVYPNSEVEIISSTGQVVRQTRVESSVQEIFMGDLPNGIYFFRLKTNTYTKNLFHKVIKQ